PAPLAPRRESEPHRVWASRPYQGSMPPEDDPQMQTSYRDYLRCGTVRGVFDGHLVPETAYGHDGGRRHRPLAQLDPQASDVDIYRSATAGVLITPDQRGKVVAGQDLVGSASERRYQAVFRWCQLDRLAAKRDTSSG